ncbi:MAG: helix-turn-helix domain-containing protein [Pseudomonadota bacterium]
MSDPVTARIRRSPETAKALFLEKAEVLLMADGLAAVQMRAVARQAGVTDAAVAHHFGNRAGLLSALMDHVLTKVRAAIGEIAAAWSGDPDHFKELVYALDALYRRGYAELAHAVSLAGWRDQGEPILAPVARQLIACNANSTTRDRDIKRVLAALHMDLALSPLFGEAFQRSVGLRQADRKAQLDWWAAQIVDLVEALG